MHPSTFVSAAVLLPCVRYRFLLCLFMCRLGLAMAYCQGPEQYEIKYISTENGLNHRIVWQAFQDHRGVLWMGVQAGLNSYDGEKVETHKELYRQQPALETCNVFHLTEDAKHHLWLGTDQGLFILNEARDGFVPPASLGIPDSVSRQKNCALVGSRSGDIWLMVGFRLYRYHNKVLQLLDKIPSKYVPSGRSLRYAEKDGALVFETLKNEVVRYRSGIFQNTTKPIYFDKRLIGPLNEQFFSLSGALGDSVSIFSGTTAHLLKLHRSGRFYESSDALQITQILPEWAAVEIWMARNRHDYFNSIRADFRLLDFFTTEDGSRCFNTKYGIFLVKAHQPQFKHLAASKGKSIRGMMEDGQGRLMVGTYHGLLHFDRDLKWASVSNINLIRFFLPANPNRFWIGLETFGGLRQLTRLGGDRFTFHKPKHIPNIDFVLCAAAAAKGFWTSAYNQALHYIRYDGDTVLYTRPIKSEFPLEPNKAALFSAYSGLWFGGKGGLQHYLVDPFSDDIRRDLTAELPELLRRSEVTALYESLGSYLWVGTAGNGIFRYHPERKTLEQWTQSEGLAHNTTYGILGSHRDSVMWISTQNGLCRFNLPQHSFYNFNAQDGLGQNEFNTGASYKSPDGTLFFGGINGITSFKPENITTPTQSRRAFFNLNIFHLKNQNARWLSPEQGETILVEPDEKYVELYLSTNELFHAQTVPLRYRITGLQERWRNQNAGEKTVFSNLAPGLYRLEAQAQNQQGRWGPVFSISLRVLPYWYETIWFRLCLALVGCVLLYWYYHTKVEQIRKAYELRKEISDDLHDGLGSRLYALKLMASKIADAKLPETDRAQLSQQFESSGSEALQTVRNFIWAFDPKQDRANQLFDRMDDFAENYLSPLVPDVSVHRADLSSDLKIGPKTKHHLMNIYQELLTNMVKHTHSTAIEVSLGCQGEYLHIDIRNWHKGYQQHGKSSESLKSGHESLTNRLKAIRAQLNWWEPTDQLQQVQIKVKVKV